MCGRFKLPKFLGCYGPGMCDVKQKDNGIDQNTPML